MSEVIAIIATERTGTNYFCDLLIKALNINGMYEIFHPDVSFGLSDALISKALSREVKLVASLNKREKADLVRANPGLILQGLASHSEKPGVFKIFPGHLQGKAVRATILENEKIHKVVIDRSPLDVFVSQYKARSIAKWRGVDTTGLRIDLDRKQFDTWFNSRSAWYEQARNITLNSGQAMTYLNYTDIESRSPEALVDFFISQMKEVGCELSKSDQQVSDLMKKQDKNTMLAEKVNNWDAFEATFPSGQVDENLLRGFLF
jgi:hypothetical protein